jgi:superoxide dismutase, Cu-Zn family
MSRLPVKAICEILPNERGIKGEIYFEQIGEKTMIKGKITNLKMGLHGIHIHTEGKNVLTCGNRACCDALGGHFNPFGQEHGYPDSKVRHVGDLGNIYADQYQTANINIVDKWIKLVGEYSVIGKSIVIHADPDDGGYGGHHDSKTTGHSGERIACGIIKKL